MSTMFALSSEISISHDKNEMYPDIPYIENGLVQRVKVEDMKSFNATNEFLLPPPKTPVT